MKLSIQKSYQLLLLLQFVSYFSLCQTWQASSTYLPPFPTDNSGVSFSSNHIGYAYYSVGNPNGGGAHGMEYRIKKSYDCMQTFNEIRHESGSMGCVMLTYMQFFNRDTGVIVESCQGYLSFDKTEDGGATWVYQQGVGLGSFLEVIYFFNPEIGFYTYRDNNRSILVRVGSTTPLFESYKYDFTNNNQSEMQIYFVNDSTGFITCRDTLNNAIVLKTVNQGVGWGEVLSIPGGKIKDIDFYTEQIGFVVGDNGLLMKTNDGGQSWTSIVNPSGNNLNTISFANDSLGLIGGESGTLLKTDDGGINWEVDTSWVLNKNIKTVKSFETTTYIQTTDGLIYRKSGSCVNSSTSIEKIYKKGKLHVYPNPTNSVFTIELTNLETFIDAQIFDMTGRLIKSYTTTTNSVFDIPKGVYLLRVNTKEKIYKKVLIKN